MSSIIYPQHYYVVKREPGSWIFRHPNIFYSGKKQAENVNKREEIYGLTKKKITISLFRINAGKCGYYIANMRDGKYYYCGESWQNVKTKFLELGIGREDPVKKTQKISQLKKDNRDAYILLCEASVYREPVTKDFWLSHLEDWDINEQRQGLALKSLLEANLAKEKITDGQSFVYLDNEIRAIATEEAKQLNKKETNDG